jgi:hypothetical protein
LGIPTAHMKSSLRPTTSTPSTSRSRTTSTPNGP